MEQSLDLDIKNYSTEDLINFFKLDNNYNSSDLDNSYKDITLNVLGPVGDIVSEWILKGAFIKSGEFGEYNWDNDAAAQNLTMTLAVDYCVLNF